MKKKLLLTSILSIVMCFSLIVGATFALFTSESTVNVAVTSGKVSVKATVESWQYTTLTEKGNWVDAALDEEVKFDNIGGTATIADGATVTLDKIVPGDGVKLNVKVVNESNVAVKYRALVKNSNEQNAVDAALFNALEIKVDGAKYYGATATNWAPLAVDATIDNIVIEVVLPEDAKGADLMGKTCKFALTVEAIQGNATPVDDIPSKDAPVDTATGTTNAETVLEVEEKATATVPSGVKLKDGATTLTLSVENAEANTGNFTLAAGTETKAFDVKVPEVAADNTEAIIFTLFGALDKNLDPNAVVLLHSGVAMNPVFAKADVDANGEFFYDATTGDVTVATNNFSNFTAVILSEDNKVEVGTKDAIVEAINNPGFITLSADITTEETIVIPEGVTVILDLNGKTITGTMHKSVGAVVKNQGTLTVKNGTISSTAENGGSAIVNNGTLTVENVTLNGATNANGSWPSYTINNTGVATLNNSTITSVHGAVASYDAGAVLTLNDSEIDMAGIPGFTSHGIYTYSSGAVIVNGGVYANKATDQNSMGGSVINGAVTITAGTFSGRIENYYGTPVIKGGTFSNDPSKYVAAGYSATKNADGTWTVVEETAE